MVLRDSVTLLVIYSIASVAGLGLLKYGLPALFAILRTGSGSLTGLVPAIGGGLLYIGSFGVWLVILNRLPLSSAYPIAIGSTLALSTVVAGLMLGETITWMKASGLGLILLGILVVFRETA